MRVKTVVSNWVNEETAGWCNAYLYPARFTSSWVFYVLVRIYFYAFYVSHFGSYDSEEEKEKRRKL